VTRRPAAAKLNLALVVGPRRADGKHELVTVFQRVDFGDRITVEPADETTIGGFPEDTIVRSALALLDAPNGWRVHIEKDVPLAAGLGFATVGLVLFAQAPVNGDYPTAMSLGRAGFEAFNAVNHRWGVISALCRIGFAAVGLGEFADAGRDLLRALELAQQSHAQSLVLHALSGAGVLLAREGNTTRAAEILLFSLHHPGIPPAYRMVAQPDLDALEAQVPREDFAAAEQALATADLDDVVQSVRRDLGRPGLATTASETTPERVAAH